MDDLSVSKGIFVHCKKIVGSKPDKKRKNDVKLYHEHKTKAWYTAYSEISLAIDETADKVHADTFRQLLFDLRDFIVKIKSMTLLEDEISTGILLAGVNLPDHDVLLKKLVEELEPVTPYVATVWSRDATTLKHLTEEVIYQIINNSIEEKEVVKKSNCTFATLNAWHKETNNGETPLVILISDFESFCPTVLHDFILILSSYMKTIKFVLIFGVATTLHIVHRSLSYDATSKLKCRVFKMQPQVERLGNVVEAIVSSPDIPFKITGKAFDMLIDIFMWFNFSVEDFLKSYKLCLWKHFYDADEFIICCKQSDISDRVAELRISDFKKLRNLTSVRNYLETIEKRKKMNDGRFKETIMDLLEKFHDYMDSFLKMLRCLFIISSTLNHPFGKSFRQIYVMAIKYREFHETSEYKKAISLINCLSKEELLQALEIIIDSVGNLDSDSAKDVQDLLQKHYNVLRDASEAEMIQEVEKSSKKPSARHEWLETMKAASKISQQSAYKIAKSEFMNYLDKEVFQVYLRHPSKVPLHEVFCFNDAETVNRNIMGSTKASLYNSLNDPHDFTGDRNCCTENKENHSKHPDINIVYSLHLENRKMINMYDWLRAFVYVLDPNHDEDQEIDPILQARFSRAVAELQFLGFIKTTRKKTDHVKRLTV